MANKYRIPAYAYYLTKALHTATPLWIGLSQVETALLRRKLTNPDFDRPVYVGAMPRSGSTITLEMLAEHPDLGTNFYRDLPMPWLPYFWHWLAQRLPLPAEEPTERIHKDRLLVTNDSPEAVEEVVWMRFFSHLHNEAVNNTLDGTVSYPRFEKFYGQYVKKLTLSRGAKRYLAKNNYNATRLKYIQRLFPQARFLLTVRHPLNHIASLMKQDRVLGEEQKSSQVHFMTRLMGHYEFGQDRRCVNVGDNALVAEVNRLWRDGRAARGWGMYWSHTYDYLLDQVEADAELRQACMVVRYEDLCQRSGETIDRILAHCDLPAAPFAVARAKYMQKLALPDYYQPSFSAQERQDIAETTQATAARLGYE